MIQAAPPPQKPVRRSQAERRADTRRRVIDATTMCLYRVGYSAVSFSMVAEEAGVSRGIITYHFATKADLMVAVRDTIQQDELRALEATQNQIGAAEYLRQLPTLVLNGMRREPAIAVNEILLAARGDPELIGKLRSIEEDIDKRTLSRLEGLYREAGMEPPPNLPAVIRLAISTFRGLAIADLALGERADIDASLALFRSMMAPVLPR